MKLLELVEESVAYVNSDEMMPLEEKIKKI